MGMIGNAPALGLLQAANLSPGAVVGNLGFTPANKAGDTITGTLARAIANNVGSNAGDSVIYDTFGCYDGSNNELLTLMELRLSNGTSWPTVGTRLQKKIDGSWMGYLEFNGNNGGGVALGAGISTVGPNASGINKALLINSAGHVTKPYQPRFSVAGSSGTYASGATLKMAGTEYDPLSNYDPATGAYTAPCAGYYHFSATVRLNATPNFTQYFRARFMKNGAHTEFIVGDGILGTFINGTAYCSWNMSINLLLAQGDAITLAVDWGGGPTSITLDNSGWSGFLVA